MFRLGKKMFVCFLALTLMMSSVSIPVSASESVVEYGVEADVVDPGIAGWPNPPVVTAETAVVMEMTTAICQYNKGRNVVRESGALNKFMIMLLAAENCDLEEEVTFSKSTVNTVKNKGVASIDAKAGEVMTVKDCLYAVALESANDAALTLAKHIGGSVNEFVDMMNARAKELGCDETVFNSATGFGSNACYTSAYDVALIVRAGLRNTTLRKIVKKTSYTIDKTNKSKKRKLVCEDPLINEENAGYYEGCRAVAIFEDGHGGYDMVAAAKRNDITYIVVTFGNDNSDNSYVDSRALLDYAHNNFEKSEFMIGSVVLPETVSTDVINVKGASDDVEVTQRYYANGWLVGKGSQDINPPKESESLLPELLPTKVAEQDTNDSEEEDDDDVIDMIEKEEEQEYFKVYGLSLRQWNWIGTVVIAVGLILYLLCALIRQRVRKNKISKMRERERRKSRYIEEE